MTDPEPLPYRWSAGRYPIRMTRETAEAIADAMGGPGRVLRCHPFHRWPRRLAGGREGWTGAGWEGCP